MTEPTKARLSPVVWVVYDSTYEKVIGVFSTESKAQSFAVKHEDKIGLADSAGIYTVWGAFRIDGENEEPLCF